jgi:hypothetical protein
VNWLIAGNGWMVGFVGPGPVAGSWMALKDRSSLNKVDTGRQGRQQRVGVIKETGQLQRSRTDRRFRLEHQRERVEDPSLRRGNKKACSQPADAGQEKLQQPGIASRLSPQASERSEKLPAVPGMAARLAAAAPPSSCQGARSCQNRTRRC